MKKIPEIDPEFNKIPELDPEFCVGFSFGLQMKLRAAEMDKLLEYIYCQHWYTF